jgi:hypothetical protein
MARDMSPQILWEAVKWKLRGVLATESNWRLAHRARSLWQPAEIEARRGLARELAAELPIDGRVDPAIGHRMLSPDSIPDVHEVCDIGRSIVADSSLAVGEANGKKRFSRFRLATRAQRTALLRVGLDRRVIAIAAAYLGVLPVITEADFYCSFAVEGPWTKSQLWHCDDDAGEVFKFFVYCDEVVADDGPFELIDAATSRRVRDTVGYRYGGYKNRVADEIMDRHVARADQRSIEGRRGTAFVIDTVSCLHRGSRIRDENRRRVVSMICFTPPSSIVLPRRLAAKRGPLTEFADEFTSPLERAVLGFPVATKWL